MELTQLALPNQHAPYHPCFLPGSLYLCTNDVNGCGNKLKDAMEIVRPVEGFDYGIREFATGNRHGCIFRFGHDIQS